MRIQKVHIALLLLMSCLIGSMFPLLKIAEQSIPPITLTMLRVLLATIVMILTVGFGMKRSLLPLITHWGSFAILGLLLSIFLLSVSEGEERISASLGALLTCIIPSATFLLTTLLLRWERFTWLRFAGTIVALVAFSLESPMAIRPSGESLLATLIVGTLSTGGTCLLLYYLIAHAGAVEELLAL